MKGVSIGEGLYRMERGERFTAMQAVGFFRFGRDVLLVAAVFAAVQVFCGVAATGAERVIILSFAATLGTMRLGRFGDGYLLRG